MIITKRDGREVSFDRNKIEEAINKAFIKTDGRLKDESKLLSFRISSSIESEIERNKDKTFTVEDIQDMVERKLMSSSRKDVAREYITYRNERTRIRERNSKFRDRIREKIFAKNVQNQNANVDEKSFGGRKGEADAVILKELALDEVMSEMSRNNHLNNEIYIHDLDSYVLGSHNCLSIPFDDLLKNGFNTRQTDVRPARSVNTAFQLVAVLFQLQSLQQFGGVAATHLDWTMVPYVRMSLLKKVISTTAYDNDCSEDEVENELYPMILGKAKVTKSENIKDDIMSVIYNSKIDFISILEEIYTEGE